MHQLERFGQSVFNGVGTITLFLLATVALTVFAYTRLGLLASVVMLWMGQRARAAARTRQRRRQALDSQTVGSAGRAGRQPPGLATC